MIFFYWILFYTLLYKFYFYYCIIKLKYFLKNKVLNTNGVHHSDREFDGLYRLN
jgi:hypothetical protein